MTSCELTGELSTDPGEIDQTGKGGKEILSKRIKPIISMDKERTIRKSDQKYKGEE